MSLMMQDAMGVVNRKNLDDGLPAFVMRVGAATGMGSMK